MIIAFRSGSSTSPSDYFTKLLPFINTFIDEGILSESSTDIALVNYGKTVHLVFGFEQYNTFSEMRQGVENMTKKFRSKFARFTQLIQFMNQELLSSPAVSETDEIHVIFIADQLYDKLDSGVRKGIENLETRGIVTHWVLIGDNSAIPTTRPAYKIEDYQALQGRFDVSFGILSEIAKGERH